MTQGRENATSATSAHVSACKAWSATILQDNSFGVRCWGMLLDIPLGYKTIWCPMMRGVEPGSMTNTQHASGKHYKVDANTRITCM